MVSGFIPSSLLFVYALMEFYHALGSALPHLDFHRVLLTHALALSATEEDCVFYPHSKPQFTSTWPLELPVEPLVVYLALSVRSC